MNEAHMKQAVELAVQNVKNSTGGPFGAVIVKDDQIIARGTNCVTSTNDPTAHAEVVAIRQACRHIKDFSLTGCEIYTSCEPCPMCLAAIYWARLDKIFYSGTKIDAQIAGFDDDFIYREMARDIKDRKLSMVRILPNEALPAFDLWRHHDNKIPY